MNELLKFVLSNPSAFASYILQVCSLERTCAVLGIGSFVLSKWKENQERKTKGQGASLVPDGNCYIACGLKKGAIWVSF